MQDLSAILLRIQIGKKAFYFCQFILAVSNVLLFNATYNPEASSEEFLWRFKYKEYFELQSKFDVDNEGIDSIVELSTLNVMALISFADQISKILIMKDVDFSSNAQFMFDNFKQHFKALPQLNDMIENITTNNPFYKKNF